MASSSEDEKPARRVMFVRAGLQRHRDMRTSFSVGSRSIIPLHVIGTGLRLSKPVYMCAKDTVSRIALGPVLNLRALQSDTYYVHGDLVSSSESESLILMTPCLMKKSSVRNMKRRFGTKCTTGMRTGGCGHQEQWTRPGK